MRVSEKSNLTNWLKISGILLGLFFLTLMAPASPVDPWGIFNLKKIATILFSLAVIQLIAELFIRMLGEKGGTLLAGFLSGLISSTALTAAIAKKSSDPSTSNLTILSLSFLSGTLAMLAEAIALTMVGTQDFHPELLWIFVGPVIATIGMIIYRLRKPCPSFAMPKKQITLDLVPTLKLAAFIFVIISASKLLQHFLGQSGLMILTFIVSLFEIHGSIIANAQLHDNGSIGLQTLGTLLAISIVASYISKLFLVSTIGSPELKKITLKLTVTICTSIFLGWSLFTWLQFQQ